MKVFISINLNNKDEFESISLIALNDNVFFEEDDIVVAWYDMIKYVTHEGLYQISMPENLHEIIDNDIRLALKYFCVEKEDFLNEEEVKELTYYSRKNVMEVIIPKKLKTFDTYKKYIEENRTGETV